MSNKTPRKLYGYFIYFKNQVIYVGVGNLTRSTNLKDRNEFYNSFLEAHGEDNFSIIVNNQFKNNSEAKLWEDSQIEKQNTMFPHGFNLIRSCYGWSENSLNLLSKNNCRHWEGKKRPEETIKKMSDSHKGQRPGNFGKKHDEETKKRISLAIKETFKRKREEKQRQKELESQAA